MNNLIFIFNSVIVPLFVFFISYDKAPITNTLPLLSIFIIMLSLKNQDKNLAIFGTITSLVITSFYFPIFAVFLFVVYLFLLLIYSERKE